MTPRKVFSGQYAIPLATHSEGLPTESVVAHRRASERPINGIEALFVWNLAAELAQDSTLAW